MERPDWTKQTKRTNGVDLSLNVHYDSALRAQIDSIICSGISFHDYPEQTRLYSAISDYYGVDARTISIGYGATEILERIFKSSDFEVAYVVEPSFEMMRVYCSLYNKLYIPITIEQLWHIRPGKSSALFIANPNGNDGSAVDISAIIDRYSYIVSDEVYADFYDKHSLLRSNSDNVIVVKSFSKSLGIAGFRCGFAVSNVDTTQQLQNCRSNFVMSSFASIIIPEIIYSTPSVVSRMNITKLFLESKFDCVPSRGNYVIFKQQNHYTRHFGAKTVNLGYRMALTDMKTLCSIE